MAITVAQFQTHLEAVRTNIGSGDYAAAEIAVAQAHACLAGLPDAEKGSSKAAWRADIVALEKIIEKLKNSAAISALGDSGIQRVRWKYVRPT